MSSKGPIKHAEPHIGILTHWQKILSLHLEIVGELQCTTLNTILISSDCNVETHTQWLHILLKNDVYCVYL